MPRIPVKIVTWDEIVEWSWQLAKRIEEAGYVPDVIVGIARGGLVPARLLCDFLNVENFLSIQSQHWTEAAKVSEKALIKFPYKVDLSGLRVLIVDDIVDTGDSMILAKEFVEKNWNPKEVKLAALQWISTVAKIKPDFYAIEVREWVWFQYPWTRLEDVTQFIKRMLTEECREKGAREWRFDQIIESFREWYGVSVDERYYREALRLLIKKGVIRESDGVYVVTQC